MTPDAAEWGFHHLGDPIPALLSPCIAPKKLCCGRSLPWHMCGRSTLGPTWQDGGDFQKCLWVVFGVFFPLTSFKTSARFLGEPGVEECPKQESSILRVLKILPSVGVLEFPALRVWIFPPPGLSWAQASRKPSQKGQEGSHLKTRRKPQDHVVQARGGMARRVRP